MTSAPADVLAVTPVTEMYTRDALRLIDAGYAPSEAIEMALADGVPLSPTDREAVETAVWERDPR